MIRLGACSPSPPSTTAPWLFNAPIDLLIGCGGWSLPLLLLTSYVSGVNPAWLATSFYFLTVFCNNPHYMATIYRAYGAGADFNQRRFFTIYVTVLLAITITIVHLAPALFPWALTLYLLWSPWHYSGQNFGIAMLLARRAGAQPDHQARQYLFGSYVVSFAVWVLAIGSLETPDPGLILFRFPREFTRLFLPFLTISFIALAGSALLRIARQSGRKAVGAPTLLTLSQGLWFIVPTLLQHYRDVKLPAAYFSAGVLAFMHCAQYLWITTYYTRREAEQLPQPQSFRFSRYYATLILGGLALFIPGPWLASWLLGHEFVESFLIFAALVNLHHFILDGAIWNLRDGRIARILIGRNAPAETTRATSREGLPELVGWLASSATPARAVRSVLIVLLVGLALVDQAQFRLSRKESGLDGLRRAEGLNPRDARVYFHRAQLLAGAGDATAARAELQKAIAINPRNVAAQQLLGEILLKSGDTAAALDQYNRLAELFPPNIVTALNRGLLAQQSSDYPLAAQQFKEALRLAPQRIQIHYLLATAYEALGDRASAAGEYALYLKLHRLRGNSAEGETLASEAKRKLTELLPGSALPSNRTNSLVN